MPSADTFPDYYAVLGVEPSATIDDIKHAYRQAAKHTHPDAGGSVEQMAALGEAYAVLSDPLQRHNYDTACRIATDAELSQDPGVSNYQEELLYTDMETIVQAEELRQQAIYHQARRIAWARQSASGLLSGSVLWLAGSLSLGIVFRPALTGGALWFWTFLNAAILTAAGFGVVSLVWPEHRLAVFDVSPFEHRYLSVRWWQISATIAATSVVVSGLITWAIIVRLATVAN